MKILVCAKRVIDPNVNVQVRADGLGMQLDGLKTALNPFDEVAVEEAVRLREAGHAGEVVAVSIGPAAARDVLRSALAMGADRGLLVELAADAEPLAAARLLAAVVRREAPDLVLMGKQSTDHDLGQTPAMLAALLDWPQALQASKIEVLDGALRVACELDLGSETLWLPLPALVSADLRLNEPRYASLPAVMKAKKKPLDIVAAADLGLATEAARLQLQAASAPSRRAAGRLLPDVEALLAALRDEARVL
ncbi:MAG: electron transfer flavoprotein subunit beta/FixA family protein [Burkholderiaceae bacterium]|nr:electron transfer flavoprotein subunit beta/FixA family protein [Burkholderiaceae bacterium]